jgi:asparagine synthase (glutamine-hydrolysing)
MLSADGRYTLTYNGEIFNFPELRCELEAEGAVFTSHCDTEAIMLGWARHGSRFLSRLRGMFALSLWDRETEKGFLARDAFGIKPLYVAQRGDTILFASEVRALLSSGLVERVLSRAGLSTFLHTGSVAEPFTIVEGVLAIEPGSVVEVRFVNGTPMLGEREVFAEAFPAAAAEVDSPWQSAFQLRNALRDSVSHHLLSDVPVAMFLSGGLDSSALVGIASEVSKHQLETFTVAFDEAEYSEGELGRAVARRFATRHHEVRMSGNDLLDALPSAFGAMDQPSLDGLNTYMVSRAVRMNGIKVALSGLGGDELFGG